MAANLSRNGPALQEAYVRVVTEKSPTNWWAPRRAGAVGGPGRGEPGGAAVPRAWLFVAALREVLSPTFVTPYPAVRESPGPPHPSGRRPRPVGLHVGLRAGLRLVASPGSPFLPGDFTALPEKEEATPGCVRGWASENGVAARLALGGLSRRRYTRSSGVWVPG